VRYTRKYRYEEVKPVLQYTFCFLFLAFYYFLHLFASYPVFCFIKVNELRKKQEIYVAKNTIVDKTVAKEKKIKGKKTGNKEHIVEWA